MRKLIGKQEVGIYFRIIRQSVCTNSALNPFPLLPSHEFPIHCPCFLCGVISPQNTVIIISRAVFSWYSKHLRIMNPCAHVRTLEKKLTLLA